LEAVIGGVNIGTADSYRIPDGSLHRPGSGGTFLSTAALALEIVSPQDETWDKLGFYASRGVDELLIVDPQQRRVHWLGLGADGEYRPLELGGLIELGAAKSPIGSTGPNSARAAVGAPPTAGLIAT
jgi:Uma2 family endonuclease